MSGKGIAGKAYWKTGVQIVPWLKSRINKCFFRKYLQCLLPFARPHRLLIRRRLLFILRSTMINIADYPF
jgi:hypothetical protein